MDMCEDAVPKLHVPPAAHTRVGELVLVTMITAGGFVLPDLENVRLFTSFLWMSLAYCRSSPAPIQ